MSCLKSVSKHGCQNKVVRHHARHVINWLAAGLVSWIVPAVRTNNVGVQIFQRPVEIKSSMIINAYATCNGWRSEHLLTTTRKQS